METPHTTKYKKFKVVGNVSVEMIDRLEEIRGKLLADNVILILGPTGAGKSSFIEALDSNKSLKISSNQLEGFTQSISLYRLVNVKRNGNHLPIYLVDVPGFADTKISEMKIVSMLKDWMADVELRNLYRILYFMPVNNPRLPGSHRHVLRTFQALTGVKTAESITIVSTMWDCVWNETGRKRAESNFEQLQDDIWKEYVDNGTKILKFHNTQESTLSILDNAIGRHSAPNFELVQITGALKHDVRETSFATNLYNDLQVRIQNLQMQITNIESDLFEATERDDGRLITMLMPRLNEAHWLLVMFKQEMHEFGPPPDNHPSTLDLISAASKSEMKNPVQQMADPIPPVLQTSNPIYHQPSMGHVLSHPPQTFNPLPPQKILEPLQTQLTTKTHRGARLTRVLDWMKR